MRQASRIKVKVQPKASRTEIQGFRADVLHVRVMAAPQRGKANQALVELLAETLSLPKTEIKILKGHTTGDKLVEVDALSQDDLQLRLGSEKRSLQTSD